MSKHTPGPWRDRDERGHYLEPQTEWSAAFDGDAMEGTTSWVPVLAGQNTIALAVSEGWDDSRMLANARLIAAAPDLLAAGKLCPDRADFGTAGGYADAIDAWWRNEMLPAITKAEAAS